MNKHPHSLEALESKPWFESVNGCLSWHVLLRIVFIERGQLFEDEVDAF